MTIDEPPTYPMARSTKCPFDPPPELRELGPLARIEAYGKPAWLVTRNADQRKLLLDPRLSADIGHPGFPIPAAEAAMLKSANLDFGFVNMDDPEHGRLRRMVTAPFLHKRIEAMRPRVQQLVDEMIDALLAGPKPADLVEALATPLPSLVICELLGVPYDDHAFFQHNTKELVRVDAAPMERVGALHNIVGYLDQLVGVKLGTPGDDLLSVLAERIQAGELDRPDAVSIGVLMLLAGHETTANQIALGTTALLEHPDQLALLRDTEDPAVVAGAVEELLRYLNVTHQGRRRAILEDIEFGGQILPAGEGLVLPGDTGNRDPDLFEEPDRLDLTRDARGHLAFGYGIHQCLGAPLARMELQVVYGTLYRRIPTLQLAVPLEDIPFKHDAEIYGVHALPVTW
ncbi:cytochrome P450 [Kribbella sp. NPDC056345]|uniref:cytochrome P450 n=1 Tax=Kribbella sp. NPDC056345 TaxID=3345789 RepID=UPI0035DF75B0